MKKLPTLVQSLKLKIKSYNLKLKVFVRKHPKLFTLHSKLLTILAFHSKLLTKTLRPFILIIRKLLFKPLYRLGFRFPTKKAVAILTLAVFIFNMFLPILVEVLDDARYNLIAGYNSISESQSQMYRFEAKNQDLQAFFGDKKYPHSHRFAINKSGSTFDLRLTESEFKCPLNAEGCLSLGTNLNPSFQKNPLIDFNSLEDILGAKASLVRNLEQEINNTTATQSKDSGADGVIREARLIQKAGVPNDKVEFIKSDNETQSVYKDSQISYEVIESGIKQTIAIYPNSLPTYQFLINLSDLRVIKTPGGVYILTNQEETMAIQISKPQVSDGKGIKGEADLRIFQEERGVILEIGVDQSYLKDAGRDFPLILTTNFLVGGSSPTLAKVSELVDSAQSSKVKSLSIRNSSTSNYLFEHLNNNFTVGIGSKARGKTKLAFSNAAAKGGGIELQLVDENKTTTIRKNTKMTNEEDLLSDMEYMVSGSIENDKNTSKDNENKTFSEVVEASNVKLNTDIEYKVYPTGVKENIILKKAPESTSSATFSYAMRTIGVEPELDEKDGIWKFYSQQEASDSASLFSIPKPYAEDAGGNITNDVKLDVMPWNDCGKHLNMGSTDDCYKVTVSVDPTWLKDSNRQYPVYIDPSIADDTTAEFAITNNSAQSSAMNRIKDTGSPVLEDWYQEMPLDNYTTALLHMNEGSGSTSDDVASTTNLVLDGTNPPSWNSTANSAIGNSSLNFDGTNDAASHTSSIWNFGSKDFTVEWWSKRAANDVAPIASATGNVVTAFLLQAGGNDIYMSSDNASWNIATGQSLGSLIPNTWTHYAVTRSGSIFIGYQNGIEKSRWTSSLSLASVTAAYFGNTQGEFSATQVDEVRVSTIPRTPEELRANALRKPSAIFTSNVFDLTENANGLNALTWTENGVSTGNGETLSSSTSLVAHWKFNENTSTTTADNAEGTATRDLTLTSMTTTGQDAAAGDGWTANNRRWGDGALMFDGTDAYASCTDANCGGTSALDVGANNTFSIAFWMQTNQTALAFIVDKSAASDETYNILINSVAGKVKFQLRQSGGTTYGEADSTTSVNDGNWHYVVGTWDGTTIRVYVDGRLEATDTSFSGTFDNDSAGAFNVGRKYTGANFYRGTLDSMYVYQRVMTANEILSNYNHTNIEFQTRTGADNTPNDSSWEAWKSTDNETTVENFDDSYQYNTTDSGLVSYWPMDETVQTSTYFAHAFSVASQETEPEGVAFKSDGTKMYVVGQTNDTVYQYSLSTAWDVSTASYDSVSFSVATQDGTPTEVAFKSDGTKMYVIGDANDTVYQYSLPTPWVLTGASYDSVSKSVAAQEGAARAVAFKSDGTKMYAMGGVNDTVYQYSLSTAWVVSSASYDSVSFSVTSQEGNPQGVAFKSDGTKMYVVGQNNGSVFQYSLPTPWVLTGASYDSVSKSVTDGTATINSVAFKSDGTKMYVVGISNDTVAEYSLAKDWFVGANPVNDVVSTNHGNALNGPTIVDGKFGKARGFDGSNDYVSVGNNSALYPNTGDFTFEAWFKTTSTSTQYIAGMHNGGSRPFWNVAIASNVISTEWDSATVSACEPVNTRTVNDGQWHHVVVSLDNGTGCNIYVDGKIDGSASTSAATINPSGAMEIGRFNAASYFDGQIDEVRIYNTNLSAATALEHFQEGIQYRGGGNIANSADFLPNTINIGVGTTSQKTVLGAPKVDTKTVALWHFDESLGVGTTGPIYDSTGYRTFATDSTGNLEQNLISFWKFDESSDNTCLNGPGTQDSCDSVSNLSADNSGTTSVAGKLNNARDLNGTTDIISFGDRAILDFGDNGDFTICGWFNRDTSTTNDTIYAHRLGLGAASVGYSVWLDATNDKVNLEVSDGTDEYSVASTTAFTSTGWNHFCAVWDQDNTTNTEIYINGADDNGTDSGTIGNVGSISTDAAGNHIGVLSDAATDFFDGKLDEMGIWGRALSASEISDLYNSGNANTLTAKSSNTLSVDGNPTPTNGFYNRAWTLDGTGDTFQCSDAACGGTAAGYGLDMGTNDFTIEAWIKSSTPALKLIVLKGAGGAEGYYLRTTAGGALQFVLVNTVGGAYVNLSGTTVVQDGKWHHVAATWTVSGTSSKVYVDGVLDNSTTSTSGTLDDDSTGTFYIGSQDGSFNWNGEIDEVRISKDDRSYEEIQEAYRAGRDHRMGRTLLTSANLGVGTTNFSGKSTLPFYVAADRPGTYLEATVGESAFANYEPDENTVGLWHLEEGAGTGAYIKDSSGYGNHATATTGSIFVQGRVGKARDFDGTDDKLTVADDADLEPATVTLDVWFKSDDVTANSVALSKGSSAGADGRNGWLIGHNASLARWCLTVADADTCFSGTSTLQNGVWYHVAGVYDGSTAKLYVNGVLENSTSYSGTLDYTGGGQDVRIGSTYSAGYAAFLNGTVDQPRISSTARSADLIRQTYEIGKRTHPVTIDFVSNPQATYTSGTSMTINNMSGQTNLSDSLKVGDTIIVQENVGGIEYRSTGTVTVIANTSSVYGTVTLASALTGLPSGGYSSAAKVFKWQREYWDLSGITLRGTHDNAMTRLTLRVTDGSQGANIWLDDLRSNTSYLTTSGNTPSSTGNQYYQYRAIFTSADPAVSANLTSVTQDYKLGPFNEQILRHGQWFKSGTSKPFWWSR